MASQVEQILELVILAGERELLSGDKVEGTVCQDGYYWATASGNSTMPPKKSVKFWKIKKDWAPEKTVKGKRSKTCSNHTLLVVLRSIWAIRSDYYKHHHNFYLRAGSNKERKGRGTAEEKKKALKKKMTCISFHKEKKDSYKREGIFLKTSSTQLS